jgi:PqqA peptide cyclase
VSHRPYTLIAELTYRCPLRCPYCSNPTALATAAGELSTEDWCRVFGEAEALGVMQLHLTGGEPLARKDLELLVRRGRELGLYTNLITSGVPLDRARLAALRREGLANVQLSIQDADPDRADRVAGYPAFAHKIEVARWVKEEGLPLTVNVVLHRGNLDHVAEVIALAERLHADRLELANTQYLGWALPNREALLPTKDQLDRAFAVAGEARARLRGVMEIVYVTPDYYATWPKACMEGWGRRFVHMDPSGLVLPCHAAHTIPGIRFESAMEKSLAWIWNESPSMSLFRGEGWMGDPCRTCARRGADFGGCRCQAYHLTGDAAAVDPACSLSPAHGIVERAREAAGAAGERRYLYRGPPVRTSGQA